MKSDRQIMNELAVKSGFFHSLTEEESQAQKRLLLSMFKDIVALCKANNLVYMMGGGSCLGAIRHQGYIPWDDDIDLNMPRDSYERFINLCIDGALGDKYEIDTPNASKDCKNAHLKVYRKGTLDKEIHCETTPFPNGVFIDIFPMDSAPESPLLRKFRGYISDFLQAVCTCVLYAQYPSKKYKEFMSLDPDGKKRYNQRIFLGKIFGIIPHKKWVWWFDRFNASSKDTGFVTIPTGIKHYVGETRPYNVYFPVTTAMFEGIEVCIPADYDAYLTSMYCNYMELPPVEKRERHFVYEFNIPADL